MGIHIWIQRLHHLVDLTQRYVRMSYYLPTYSKQFSKLKMVTHILTVWPKENSVYEGLPKGILKRNIDNNNKSGQKWLITFIDGAGEWEKNGCRKIRLTYLLLWSNVVFHCLLRGIRTLYDWLLTLVFLWVVSVSR